MTLKEYWEEFEQKAVLPEATRRQRDRARLLFYAAFGKGVAVMVEKKPSRETVLAWMDELEAVEQELNLETLMGEETL